MRNYFLCLTALALILVGCTANERAKNWGGTETIRLPKGEKLVNATWKEDHLWYVTTPRDKEEKPRTSTFHERSSYGVLQGTVIFVEE